MGRWGYTGRTTGAWSCRGRVGVVSGGGAGSFCPARSGRGMQEPMSVGGAGVGPVVIPPPWRVLSSHCYGRNAWVGYPGR